MGNADRREHVMERTRAAVLAVVVTLITAIIVSTFFFRQAQIAKDRAATEARLSELEALIVLSALTDEDLDEFLRLSMESVEAHRTKLGTADPRLAVPMVRYLTILDLLGGVSDSTPPEVQATIEQWGREADTLMVEALTDPSHETATIPGFADAAVLWAGRDDREDTTVAEQLLRGALAIRLEHEEPGNPGLDNNIDALVDVLRDRGREMMGNGDPRSAEPVFREALDLQRQIASGSSGTIARLEGYLGECLTILEEYTEAEALLLDSYSYFKDRPPRRRGRLASGTRDALGRLVSLYEGWGEQDTAAEYHSILDQIAS